LLWYSLRVLKPLGLHFRRQAPIGRYFPDFVCHRSKLVVELDGSQHANGEIVRYDKERTAYLNSRGYRVLRFWNSDVTENRDGVVEIIIAAAKSPPPRPASGDDLPAWGEVKDKPRPRRLRIVPPVAPKRLTSSERLSSPRGR